MCESICSAYDCCVRFFVWVWTAIWEPVWSWISSTYQSCSEESCIWWCLCCNKWVCVIFLIIIWVLTWVLMLVLWVFAVVWCIVCGIFCLIICGILQFGSGGSGSSGQITNS